MANTLVQSPTATGIVNGTTVNLAFASGGTVGSLYIAVVTLEGTNTITSVVDDRNGSWGAADVTVSSGAVGSGSGTTAFFSVANTSTSIATVTLTCSAGSYAAFDIFEITSPGGTPTLDSTGSGSGDGTARTATCTTVAANCSVFAGTTHYTGDAVVDSGYTEMYTYGAINTAYHYGEYLIDAGAAGAKTLNFEEPDTSDGWSIAIAAYAPFSAGGGVVNARNGIALSGISAINGITKTGISHINGLTI